MKMFSERSTRERVVVRCTACETHRRPECVPWEQHAVACAVRATQLARRRPAPRPAVGFVAGALHL